MNTNTITTYCNHGFCLLGGKSKVAVVKVIQTVKANGNVMVTNCCPSCYDAMTPLFDRVDSSCEWDWEMI